MEEGGAGVAESGSWSMDVWFPTQGIFSPNHYVLQGNFFPILVFDSRFLPTVLLLGNTSLTLPFTKTYFADRSLHPLTTETWTAVSYVAVVDSMWQLYFWSPGWIGYCRDTPRVTETHSASPPSMEPEGMTLFRSWAGTNFWKIPLTVPYALEIILCVSLG